MLSKGCKVKWGTFSHGTGFRLIYPKKRVSYDADMIWLELYGLTAAAGTAFFASSSRPRPKSTFVAGLVFFSAGVRGLRCYGFVIGEQYCIELFFPLRGLFRAHGSTSVCNEF